MCSCHTWKEGFGSQFEIGGEIPETDRAGSLDTLCYIQSVFRLTSLDMPSADAFHVYLCIVLCVDVDRYLLTADLLY